MPPTTTGVKRPRGRPRKSDASVSVSRVTAGSSSDSDMGGLSDVSSGSASSGSSGSDGGPRYPSAREQARKWRRLTVDERDAITADGGVIWSSARAAEAQVAVGEIQKAIARIDERLNSTLIPPLLRGPQRRETPSSLLAWRDDTTADEQRAIQALLLPEAEQAVELGRAKTDQESALTKSRERIKRLKENRKRLKTDGVGAEKIPFQVSVSHNNMCFIADTGSLTHSPTALTVCALFGSDRVQTDEATDALDRKLMPFLFLA